MIRQSPSPRGANSGASQPEITARILPDESSTRLNWKSKLCKNHTATVATLEVLFAGGVETALTTLAAASLLVFCLLYTPCVAAIAAVKRELGGKWAVLVVLWQCGIAWIAAMIVKIIGNLMGVM